MLMKSGGVRAIRNWDEHFDIAHIRTTFNDNIYPKGGQGVDRISVSRFKESLDEQALIIQRKGLIGTYKFSPYLEHLRLKGKGKSPRTLSIPTVRDRIVLKLLTSYIHDTFPQFLAKDLPNTVIKRIKSRLRVGNVSHYIRLDLKSFYDTIPHDGLLDKLRVLSDNEPFIRLIRSAIKNPTLPAGYNASDRLQKQDIGVPQGLAISNILAEIYVHSFDAALKGTVDTYFRFVDDVLILCEEHQAEEIWKRILDTADSLRLQINEQKSTPKNTACKLSDGIDFLGYRITSDIVTVRDVSYDRFLHSLLGRITQFKHKKDKHLWPKIDDAARKTAFLDELNERITGAIDGNRRFGWVFFFSEINDKALLDQIDRTVYKVISRIPEVTAEDLGKLKSVRKAYYAANTSPRDGYIHDYNAYETLHDKISFLVRRGRLKADEEASYTSEGIEILFEKVKAGNLLKLDKDKSMVS